MIRIKTDDAELLKEACESLAWRVAYFYLNPCIRSDKEIAKILRCEGLEVEVEE